MLFGTRNMLKKYVPHFNYLGIKLDNLLTFKQHACETKNIVAHKLYLFSRIRKCISTQQVITIYRIMIVPYFEYGNILR